MEEHKHAILILPRCSFRADCPTVTHAWHESSPTWLPEEQCSVKMRTHLSASVPYCLQTGIQKHPHRHMESTVLCCLISRSWYHGRWIKRMSHDMRQRFPVIKITMLPCVMVYHKRRSVRAHSNTYTFILRAYSQPFSTSTHSHTHFTVTNESASQHQTKPAYMCSNNMSPRITSLNW